MSLGVAMLVLAAMKAQSADLSLQVGRSPEPAGCQRNIWFDFFPNATLDYAKKLIATESVEVTAAIRQWDDQTWREVQLAKQPAWFFKNDDRTVYAMEHETGALVMQAMGCMSRHDEWATKVVEAFLNRDAQEKAKRLAKTQKPPPLKELAHVPATLDEALTMLEKLMDAESLAKVRASKSEDDMHALHFGFGMGLRNGWGLWGGSPLAKHFNAMGIFHPDDMSGIILTSFWRKQHGAPLQLEKQVAYYRRYWDLRKGPESSPCGDGGAPKSVIALEAPDRVVQVWSCGKQLQAYELDAGWYLPDEKLRKRVESLKKQGNIVSAGLEDDGRTGTVEELKK